MSANWTFDLTWWVTAVELPAMAGLFWMVWRTRRDADTDIEAARRLCETGLSQMREALSGYKLEVAKSYASISYIKDVEKRLTAHLERIEHKLDGVQASAGAGGRS